MKDIKLIKALITNKMFRKSFFIVKTNRIRLYLKIPYYFFCSMYFNWKRSHKKASDPWQYYLKEKAMEEDDLEYIEETCDATKFNNTMILLFSLTSDKNEVYLSKEDFVEVQRKILDNMNFLKETSFEFNDEMYRFMQKLTWEECISNSINTNWQINRFLNIMSTKVYGEGSLR